MTISEKPDQIYKGIFYACVAFGCITVVYAFGKALIDHRHAFEIGFYRYVFSGLFLTTYLFFTKFKSKKTTFELLHIKKPIALFFRVIIGASGLILMFAATKYLSVSEVSALVLTSVLMVPFLATVFLKEQIGWHRWLAVFIGFGGAYMIINPQGGFHVLGVALALSGAFTHACISILLRYLKEESSFAITFYFIWGGALFCSLFMPFVAQALTSHDFFLLFSCGFFGAISQICLASAFKYAPASLIAPFNYMKVVFAGLFDLLLWAYIPGWNVFFGAAVIIAAKCYMVYRENKREQS